MSESVKGKAPARKTSFKNRKPPEVRQTLTSKYRLLKSNPLLMKAAATSLDGEILINQPLKTLANVLGNSTEILNSKLPPKTTKVASTSVNGFKQCVKILAKPKINLSHSNSSKIDFTSDQILSSTLCESRRESVRKINLTSQKVVNNRAKPPVKPSTTTTKSHAKPSTSSQNRATKEQSLRKSLSAEHIDYKKKEIFKQLRTCNEAPRRSQSFQEPQKHVNTTEHNISTITEEGSTPQFKTPVACRPRMTPNTDNCRRSMYLSTPGPSELSERLNAWLKRRGKSLGDFHHLQCFGIHSHGRSEVTTKFTNEENKENVEASHTNTSYEELRVTEPQKAHDIIEVAAEKEPQNLEVVAKEALQDLHKLILEGYPDNQCEVWLKLIKQRYTQLEEDPQYWECRAAIEQAKGNINMAVECYQTAIVQGAEVQVVEESLEQLLQKFSLLNIDSNERTSRGRAKVLQDARNIFKSSIIQFAVRERVLKIKNKDGVETIDKKLVVTPVRRSTRVSRSAYTSTPGVKIYSSLQEVDYQTRESINFIHNKALK